MWLVEPRLARGTNMFDWFIFAPLTVSRVGGALTQELIGLPYVFERIFAYVYSFFAWYPPIFLLISLKYSSSKKSNRIIWATCIVLWIAPLILHAIAQLNK